MLSFDTFVVYFIIFFQYTFHCFAHGACSSCLPLLWLYSLCFLYFLLISFKYCLLTHTCHTHLLLADTRLTISFINGPSLSEYICWWYYRYHFSATFHHFIGSRFPLLHGFYYGYQKHFSRMMIFTLLPFPYMSFCCYFLSSHFFCIIIIIYHFSSHTLSHMYFISQITAGFVDTFHTLMNILPFHQPVTSLHFRRDFDIPHFLATAVNFSLQYTSWNDIFDKCTTSIHITYNNMSRAFGHWKYYFISSWLLAVEFSFSQLCNFSWF